MRRKRRRTSPRELRTRYQRGADFEREVRDYLVGNRTKKKPIVGLVDLLCKEYGVSPRRRPTVYSCRSAGSRGVFDVVVTLTYDKRRHYTLGVQCKKGRLSMQDREQVAVAAYTVTHIPSFFIWKQSGKILSIPDIKTALTNIIQQEAHSNDRPEVAVCGWGPGTDSLLWFAGLTIVLKSRRQAFHKCKAESIGDVRLAYWCRLAELLHQNTDYLSDLGILTAPMREAIAVKLNAEAQMNDYVQVRVEESESGLVLPDSGLTLWYKHQGAVLEDDESTSKLLYLLARNPNETIRYARTGLIVTQSAVRPTD